jgi:hypothetical protein
MCPLASTTQRNNTAGEIELSTIAREPNKYEGIIFVPGHSGEEFAVTIPDGKGRTKTIGYERSLEYAVAFRGRYLEQRNREQLCADAPNTDIDTAASVKGEYEQTQ